MTPSDGRLPEIRKSIEGLAPEDRRVLSAWLREKLDADQAAAKEARRARRRSAEEGRPLHRAVLWSLMAFLLFFGADAALFRSGWYTEYLEPNSTTGQLELHLFWLLNARRDQVPAVAVTGDSRIAEGFSARRAAQESDGRIRFWNMGVPGSSPRTWYYLLRDADPDRTRFAAIVLALDHYTDRDDAEAPPDRVSDLNYLAARLRLTDCFEFAASYRSAALRHSVFAGCAFKGIPLRRDFQDFLAAPEKRFDLAWEWRNQGHGYIDGYSGKPESLAGLTVDWAKRKIQFPPGTLDWQRSAAEGTLLPVAVPQTGALTEYRKKWLGKILDLYRNSMTRIVFLELPRAPLPVQDGPVPARFLDSLTGRPRLTVLPQETFRDLERPDLFADGLHLNHDGRPMFSARLGRITADILGLR